jgi:Rrf2 family protein
VTRRTCRPTGHNAGVRISARADYALRALIELAAEAGTGPVKGDRIAEAQSVPIKFLENILAELRRHGLVDSRRGADGGYWLRVPAESVTVADVIRIVDGPLANIRGLRPDDIVYSGSAAPLRDVWLALRTSMRGVLEHVTLADIASAELPELVIEPEPPSAAERIAGPADAEA